MMKHEFEEIAGYEVSTEDYDNIIEPMYMATNMSKQDFVKTINRKRFEQKHTRKPHPVRMSVIDRSGCRMTPNRCWYHVEYVDLVEVRIKDGKYIVQPLPEETLREISRTNDLNKSTGYEVDYLDCIDKKTRKPVELEWL